ncbi:hypothetical protein C1T15_29160, partial [Escherichia coli]
RRTVQRREKRIVTVPAQFTPCRFPVMAGWKSNAAAKVSLHLAKTRLDVGIELRMAEWLIPRVGGLVTTSQGEDIGK